MRGGLLSPLDRKLLRDLRGMAGQLAAIALILACGVASFVAVVPCYDVISRSRDAYYGNYRMPDVFAPCKKAPVSVVRELGAVPGVRRARGRIVFDVTLDMPDLAHPASGRMVSMPDRRTAVLGDIHLVRGRWFEGDGTGEVIVAEGFAQAHGLEIGDRIPAIMNERKQPLRIVATALSPEHVWMVRGLGDLLPDPTNFTVLWVSETFAESVFDFGGACNEIVATLGREARLDDVIAEFDTRLDRYGAFGAYGVKDQLSNYFLSDDLKQLSRSATRVPPVFLGVAAFVLHMLLSRLARSQRTQIAVFRAFGYTLHEMVVHYVKLALIVGALGSTAGVLLGIWFARALVGLYAQYYTFPVLSFRVQPWVVLVAVGVTLLASVLGAASSVRAVARLQPADGLRSEAPPIFRPTLIERWRWAWSRLGFAARMALRSAARARVRSILTVLGATLATSLLVLTFAMQDAVDFLLAEQFDRIERQDVQVTFHEERGGGAIREMRRLPAVRRAEPILTVPVELVNGWRKERTVLTGLERGQVLRGIGDGEDGQASLPASGLLLSRFLAEELALGPGDDVEVRVLYGKKQHFRVPVARLVEDYLGVAAYADIDALARWVDEDEASTGALLLIDSDRADELDRRLKDLPAVASVLSKARTIRNFEDSIERSWVAMNVILVLFAGAMTFGVLYNAARIALAEQQRVLASMQVLGFTNREVGATLVGENLTLSLLAIAPGVALGALFFFLITSSYDSEVYRFPFALGVGTVLRTVLLVVVFAALANAAVWLRLRRLDMVEVLKARE